MMVGSRALKYTGTTDRQFIIQQLMQRPVHLAAKIQRMFRATHMNVMLIIVFGQIWSANHRVVDQSMMVSW